ncbi:MAG: hypothetical protein KF708_09795 [Pirellulales bacterium]|nr:hypothetical protein [Pirellulales bacterium]
MALTQAMISRFGGVNRLSAEWFAALEAAREREPGGRLMLISMLAIVRLMEAASRVAPQPNLAVLSDEELEREVDRCLDRVLE